VAIVTWVAGTDERSSPRRYWCVRMRDRRLLARAETVWIWVDLHSGRARPIPERVRQAFEVVTDENEVTEFVATCLPEDAP
jgi:acyl-CoA thioester hydrolase